MALENVTGNLLAYKELEPGTFQHADQLTTERRTNHELRSQWFYTADGELYTVKKGEHLWVLTREPQNLVLNNIDEAYRQLTSQGNYFPDAETANTSLEHKDSVVIDLKGLRLENNNVQYGHFVVDPKAVKKLNSEQRRAVQRIYGPDEESFGLNMEMFAGAGITPSVFVLMPGYVRDTLKSHDTEFLALAGFLYDFYGSSSFSTGGRSVYINGSLRGVRRGSGSKEVAEGDSAKKSVSLPEEELIDRLEKEFYLKPENRGLTFSARFAQLEIDPETAAQSIESQEPLSERGAMLEID